LVFNLELYDPKTEHLAAYTEYDTKCKVTILDEDFPGTLGFVETSLVVSRNQKDFDLEINRSEGADGKISCEIRTLKPEHTTGGLSMKMAVANEDFVPIER